MKTIVLELTDAEYDLIETVLRDSVHTSMYYAKRLLPPSCSLSLSLSSYTRYVPVWYGIYHTGTYRNSPGTPPIAFAYKGGVA